MILYERYKSNHLRLRLFKDSLIGFVEQIKFLKTTFIPVKSSNSFR